MKSKRHQLPFASLLVLAGGIIGITSSSAATVTTVSGDVFLGFRASGGTGASTSYLVNIGQASQFLNATPGSTISLNSIGDIGADLTATFGANWNTRPDLFWSVFGATTAAAPSLYISKERSDTDVQSSPWSQVDATQATSTKGEILSVTTGINGYLGRESTANSPVAVLQPNFAGAASYNYQVTQSGTDFGSVSQWSGVEGDFGSGVAGTVLDLYRIKTSNPQSVGYLGSFSIGNSGGVSFAAIPEPSVSLLGGVATLLVLAGRRHRAA